MGLDEFSGLTGLGFRGLVASGLLSPSRGRDRCPKAKGEARERFRVLGSGSGPVFLIEVKGLRLRRVSR